MALTGGDKTTLLSARYSPVDGQWEENALSPKTAEISEGSFKDRQPPDIKGTGYVVDTLEAVHWAFHHTEEFRASALKVANLRVAADTTAAIHGQIAGAHYGIDSIPSE